VPSFPLFLTALIILAAGITALQVAANPYVAVLGAPETASSRLNLTQAFNSFGTFVAPYLGSLFILSAVARSATELRAMSPSALHAYRLQQASSVKLPYLVIATALVVLGLIIAKFHLPILSVEQHSLAPGDSVWKHRHLVLGAIAIFVYVGGEVAIGSFLVNYLGEPNIANLTAQVAAKYVSLYWGGAMVGRFIGSWLLRKVSPGRLLGLFALVAAALVTTSMLNSGAVAQWSILSVGLFNSIMFPTIFTLAIDGLGALTGKASGLLCAAIVGGAIIPELQGVLADKVGIHHAFVLPVLCYLYILFYGFSGCKRTVNSRSPQSALPRHGDN
jgi:FHS family L-fucose permease-like MFS transporter